MAPLDTDPVYSALSHFCIPYTMTALVLQKKNRSSTENFNSMFFYIIILLISNQLCYKLYPIRINSYFLRNSSFHMDYSNKEYVRKNPVQKTVTSQKHCRIIFYDIKSSPQYHK